MSTREKFSKIVKRNHGNKWWISRKEDKEKRFLILFNLIYYFDVRAVINCVCVMWVFFLFKVESVW